MCVCVYTQTHMYMNFPDYLTRFGEAGSLVSDRASTQRRLPTHNFKKGIKEKKRIKVGTFRMIM